MPLLGFGYVFRLGVLYVYGREELTPKVLLFMDDVMVVGVVGWLMYQVGIALWNRRERIGSTHVFALA